MADRPSAGARVAQQPAQHSKKTAAACRDTTNWYQRRCSPPSPPTPETKLQHNYVTTSKTPGPETPDGTHRTVWRTANRALANGWRAHLSQVACQCHHTNIPFIALRTVNGALANGWRAHLCQVACQYQYNSIPFIVLSTLSGK